MMKLSLEALDVEIGYKEHVVVGLVAPDSAYLSSSLIGHDASDLGDWINCLVISRKLSLAG